MADCRVASAGAALAVHTAGTGDPVIFLHANICDSRSWRTQMQAVSATHYAIAYDRRGFGETVAKAEDHSALSDLLAVMDACADGKPAILVGNSLGGRVALHLALRHPARLRALVLIAPNVTGAPDATYTPEVAATMAQLKAAEAAGDHDRISTMRARLFLDGALGIDGRVQGAARDLMRAMSDTALHMPPVGTDRDTQPIHPHLHEIAAPALVAWGELDLPHVQARSRHVAATLPHGTAYPIADSGHLPSLDQPDIVSALVLRAISAAG